jgi:signal transduction histidine kinase
MRHVVPVCPEPLSEALAVPLPPEYCHIADRLTRDAADLGTRWQMQVRSYAPRTPSQQALADAPDAERVVRAVAAALRGDADAHDGVVHAGWGLGATSHVVGMSLHYMLKEVDLLASILLYACERALADEPEPGSAAAGVALARRLHKVLSLLTLAAAKGFTHAYVTDLQSAYRTLRHELRNPIGTIKGAVSPMEDESVAPEMRNDPRFRAMVSRNATSLESVIGEQLSDAAPLVPAFARQEVSLREVALAVRRDLREVAGECGCQIVVDSMLPTVLTDATAFELALKSVVTTVLRISPPGSAVTVGFGELRERSAVVTVRRGAAALSEESRMPDESPPEEQVSEEEGAEEAEEAGEAGGCVTLDALAFARELADRAGGSICVDGPVVSLEVPVSAAHSRHDVARAG